MKNRFLSFVPADLEGSDGLAFFPDRGSELWPDRRRSIDGRSTDRERWQKT